MTFCLNCFYKAKTVSSERRIHLLSSQSLTSEVVGAPHMTLQQYLSTRSSAALRESPNPIAVHSLMLSSHLFFYLPLLLAPFTVPCRIVFAMPEDLEMWSFHLSFCFFTMIMHSNCFLNSVAKLLVRHKVFVGNVQKSPIVSHFKSLDPSLDFCCQGPALKGIKEGR